MAELTLNETWEKCLAMWKWIAEVYVEGGRSVHILKEAWVQKHPLGAKIHSNCFNCFFCDSTHGNCAVCPGKTVNKNFNCCDPNYHYKTKPKAFYQKLLELYTIRESRRQNNGRTEMQ